MGKSKGDNHLHHLHLSLNRKGRRGITNDFTNKTISEIGCTVNEYQVLQLACRISQPLCLVRIGSTGTFSGNCRETKTRMVRAYHAPQHPLQNYLSGSLGVWVTLWSVMEMLHGHRQRVDISVHDRTVLNDLQQKERKKLKENLC